MRLPHGTPLMPDISNLPPGGNPIGTPTVKVDQFWSRQLKYLFTMRLMYTCYNQQLATICLFEQSELSSSAWHTKFHGISNIQTWMWSTLHSYGFYDKFYFMPINPFICFPMAHRWSDRLSLFRSSSYAFGFFRAASSPFTNLLVLCSRTAPCPETAAQATTATTAAAADQAADHCKAFPKLLRAGFWLAAILTRSERGANEVRNQIIFGRLTP